MSNENNKDWLFRMAHMKEAIEEIQLYTKVHDMSSFLGDQKTIRSVERCFEILGEAARKIPVDIQARLPEIPWKRITGLRNILAHDYDRTRAAVLWVTVEKELPILHRSIVALLAARNG